MRCQVKEVPSKGGAKISELRAKNRRVLKVPKAKD